MTSIGRTIWDLPDSHPVWRLVRTLEVVAISMLLGAANCNDFSWDEILQSIETGLVYGGGIEGLSAFRGRKASDECKA
jgi:3-oxoacyl-(acyl-carrier-protein) synthase